MLLEVAAYAGLASAAVHIALGGRAAWRWWATRHQRLALAIIDRLSRAVSEIDRR